MAKDNKPKTSITVGGRTYHSVEEAMGAAERVGRNNQRAERVFDALRRAGLGKTARQAQKYYTENGFSSGAGLSSTEVAQYQKTAMSKFESDRDAGASRLKSLNPKGRITDITSYEEYRRKKALESGAPADSRPATTGGFASSGTVTDRELPGSVKVVGGGSWGGRRGRTGNTFISATSKFTGGRNATIKDSGSVWHDGWGSGGGGGFSGSGVKTVIDPTAPKGNAFRDARGYYQGGEFLGTARDGTPVFSRRYDGTMSRTGRDVRHANDRMERDETVRRNAWIMSPEGRMAAAQRQVDREYARLVEIEAARQRDQMRALADLARLGALIDADDSPQPPPQVAKAPHRNVKQISNDQYLEV